MASDSIEKHGPPMDFTMTIKILAMAFFSFQYGMVCAMVNTIISPDESAHLWPHRESLMLGVIIAIVAAASLPSPYFGSLSDNYKSSWGRRRPLFFACQLVFMLGVGSCMVCSIYELRTFFLLSLFIATMMITACQNLYFALLRDQVPDQHKGFASGVSAALGFVGPVLGYGVTIAVPNPSMTNMYITFIVLAVVCCLVYLSIHEEPSDGKPTPNVAVWDKLVKMINDPEEKDFLRVVCSRLFFYVALSPLLFFLFYTRDHLILTDDEMLEQRWVAIICFISYTLAGIVSVPIGKLSDSPRIGRKRLLYLGAFSSVLAAPFFIFAKFAPTLNGKFRMMLVGGGLMSFSCAAFQSIELALAMDTLANKDEAGTAIGFWNYAYFVGAAGGGLVSGALLYSIDYIDEMMSKRSNPEVNEGYAYGGYVAVFTLGALANVYSAYLVRDVNVK